MREIVYTVTEISEYIKKLLEEDPYLVNVSVYGEITNVRPRKGHIFFSLVDENAKLDCVLFGGDNMGIRLQEGKMALVDGSISVYTPHGTYRFVCSNIRYLDHIGTYQMKFETTLKKLLEEGLLYRPKRPLPRFPRRIGVITSRSSAAFHDVIRTAKERKSPVEIYLFHTSVQGDSAKKELIEALRKANEYDLDLVLIVRGGGSREDLWVFNEEEVVREILKMKHPVVTGIGHEIDRVIADFVADVSMHTPTGAAEYVLPDLRDVHEELKNLYERMKDAVLEKITREEERLNRLFHYIKAAAKRKYEINKLTTIRVKEMAGKLRSLVLNSVRRKQERVEHLFRVLESLKPTRFLDKGFVLVKKEGKIVKEAASLNSGDIVFLIFRDGEKKARVI